MVYCMVLYIVYMLRCPLIIKKDFVPRLLLFSSSFLHVWIDCKNQAQSNFWISAVFVSPPSCFKSNWNDFIKFRRFPSSATIIIRIFSYFFLLFFCLEYPTIFQNGNVRIHKAFAEMNFRYGFIIFSLIVANIVGFANSVRVCLSVLVCKWYCVCVFYVLKMMSNKK